MSETTSILVVDDEEDLREILKFNLETEGYQVATAASGEEALASHPERFQLILLDVMMDGMSGYAVAKALRESPATADTPIIFLTAKGSENDRITGFSIGADDYIAKPFSIREVMLRIQAVLRRTQRNEPEEEPHIIRYRGLTVNTDSKTVEVDGRPEAFTKTEYRLLCTLLTNKGCVFSRQDLIRTVWPRDVVVSNRTVDVNITRLRKKLGQYADNIVTRLGFGYSFQP